MAYESGYTKLFQAWWKTSSSHMSDKSKLQHYFQFHSKLFLFWFFQEMWWLMTHFILIPPVGKPKCSASEHHDHHLLHCLHHALLNSLWSKELMSLPIMCHDLYLLPSEFSISHTIKTTSNRSLPKSHEQKHLSLIQGFACSQGQEIWPVVLRQSKYSRSKN